MIPIAESCVAREGAEEAGGFIMYSRAAQGEAAGERFLSLPQRCVPHLFSNELDGFSGIRMHTFRDFAGGSALWGRAEFSVAGKARKGSAGLKHNVPFRATRCVYKNNKGFMPLL